MRPGAYVIKERLKEMDLNGVWASVCFPSFLPGFVGQRLTLWPEDEELAWAAMRAYNDWHLEAWAGEDPDRIIPNQIATAGRVGVVSRSGTLKAGCFCGPGASGTGSVSGTASSGLGSAE